MPVLRFVADVRNGALALSVCSVVLLLSGCRTLGGAEDGNTRARFAIESDHDGGYAALVTLPLSGVRIPVEPDAVISEFDYQTIEAVELELGQALLFHLKPAAARDFYSLTVANQGKRLVLLLNGDPVGARRIEAPISDGRIYMFIEAPDEAVKQIAKELRETNVEIQKRLNR